MNSFIFDLCVAVLFLGIGAWMIDVNRLYGAGMFWSFMGHAWYVRALNKAC